MLLIVVILLALVLIVTFFVYQQALRPNLFHSSTYTATALSPSETLDELYSLYPHLRPWQKRLKAAGLWRETTIEAPAQHEGDSAVRLHAFYIPASTPTRHTAILVHGYRTCALDMLHIAYLYHHELGFNVLLPDLRAHGQSQGQAVGFGWTDADDIRRWALHAERLFPAADGTPTKQVLHGISMGASTVMFLTGRADLPPQICAAVADCGYSSVDAELAYVLRRDYALPRVPFITLASQLCRLTQGWSFDEASCVEAVSRSKLPMLFIHGTADRFVPVEMAHQLYEAKPQPKEIWELADVTHARAYHDFPDDYTRRVRRFVDQYLYLH